MCGSGNDRSGERGVRSPTLPTPMWWTMDGSKLTQRLIPHASFAADPGGTLLSGNARLRASGTSRITGTTSSGFVVLLSPALVSSGCWFVNTTADSGKQRMGDGTVGVCCKRRNCCSCDNESVVFCIRCSAPHTLQRIRGNSGWVTGRLGFVARGAIVVVATTNPLFSASVVVFDLWLHCFMLNLRIFCEDFVSVSIMS